MTSDPSSSLILFAALLFLVSILATVVTPRVGVPLLLVFLVIGMLAGEDGPGGIHFQDYRSEEHTSELQTLMRISYAVFCLKKKTKYINLKVPIQYTHTNQTT